MSPSTVLALVIAAATIAIVVAGAFALRMQDVELRRRTARRVLVQTTSGAAWLGLLRSHDRRIMVLADPTEVGEKSTSVDGELVLPWSQVAWVQVVEGAAA